MFCETFIRKVFQSNYLQKCDLVETNQPMIIESMAAIVKWLVKLRVIYSRLRYK